MPNLDCLLCYMVMKQTSEYKNNRDEVERTAGKALNFRGALNLITVVSATLSDWK